LAVVLYYASWLFASMAGGFAAAFGIKTADNSTPAFGLGLFFILGASASAVMWHAGRGWLLSTVGKIELPKNSAFFSLGSILLFVAVAIVFIVGIGTVLEKFLA